MNNSENVSFMSNPVSEKKIKEVFENLRELLMHDYPSVKNITMPPIKAFTLPSKIYNQTERRLLKSEHIYDKGREEYGSPSKVGQSSASIFWANFDEVETWIIIKREGFGYSLDHDLKHEMTHIFEAIMLMPTGTLTNRKYLNLETDLDKYLK